jgi:hypothetical protein
VEAFQFGAPDRVAHFGRSCVRCGGSGRFFGSIPQQTNDRNVRRPSSVVASMPRFFFHIADGDRFPDEEGVVLSDVTAAVQVASVGARDIVAEDLKQGKGLSLNDRIEIHDESGHVVAVVTFREAVGLDGQPR